MNVSPGVRPGQSATLLAATSRAAATTNSNPFYLIEGGGAEFTIDITSVGAAGVVTDVNIQKKNGTNYDTVIAFSGLSITATGRYTFRCAPGATATGTYAGTSNEYPPVRGRVQTIHTTNAMTFKDQIEAVGP